MKQRPSLSSSTGMQWSLQLNFQHSFWHEFSPAIVVISRPELRGRVQAKTCFKQAVSEEGREFCSVDANHPLPLTLGPENVSRPKAVVWTFSSSAHTINSIFRLYWEIKKVGKTDVQEIPNHSTCAVKANLNSGTSSVLGFGNSIKAFY